MNIKVSAIFVCALCAFVASVTPASGQLTKENVQSEFKKYNSMQSKQILENIFSRKSVRHFTGKVVSKDDLTMVVKAGMAAPTGKNMQPWEFLAVNDPERIFAIAESMGKTNPMSARTGAMIKEAGAVIVVCGRPDVSHNWMLDCAAATENILLAIESMGMGAVWTAAWPYEDRLAATTEAFGLPEDVVPLCVIPVGYPKYEKAPMDKWKPEKLHFDKW